MSKSKATASAHGRGAERRASSHRIRISKKRRQRIILCLAVCTTLCAVIFAVIALPRWHAERELRKEQALLPKTSPFDAEWLEINPEYVGWLRIDGTNINYPVARGRDNEKYLTTTFSGKKNMLGAIFMDYRCTGKDLPHIIIYGHQVNNEKKDLLMFGGLTEFLDKEYLEEHPIIAYMENDFQYEFEIFSARLTDINDPAYQLDFTAPDSFENFLGETGAPIDAKQIITLSTCVGADNDKRMIVQGSLKRVAEVTTEQDEDGWKIIKPKEG